MLLFYLQVFSWEEEENNYINKNKYNPPKRNINSVLCCKRI